MIEMRVTVFIMYDYIKQIDSYKEDRGKQKPTFLPTLSHIH